MKFSPRLHLMAVLLAGYALLDTAAHAQLINGNFSNGLTGWYVSSSTTVIPPLSRPFPPPGLSPGGGSATVSGGALVSNGFVPTAPDTLVATALTQRFSLVPTAKMLGPLGGGVGRLRLSNFGSLQPHVTLSFNAQFLSNERGTPGGVPIVDYGGAMLNSTPLLLLDNKDTVVVPNSHGFTSTSTVRHVSVDVTSLFGTDPTLTFFASDTGDSVWRSGLLVSEVSLKFVLEDIDAIASVWDSGLPFALAQRQVLLNVAFNANRDVNGRLFRLRSETGEAGSAGPNGYSKEAKESKEVEKVIPPEKRWAFFATGNYGYRDVNNIDLAAGFQTDLFTATIGGEYKLTPYLRVGVAATRVEADNDLGSLGNANIEGWSYDAYASYAANNFYADLLYALGTYNHQINRNTGFLGNTATARPDSLTNSIQFNTGYNIRTGGLVTGPLASLNWVHGDIDGYNEQQGGNANLSVPEQHVDSLTSEFGWQLSAPMHTGFGSVTPQVRASWVHEYMNSSKNITVGLQNSPYYLIDGASVSRIGSYSATGATNAPGNDYMSVGAGVSFGIGDRAAVLVDWEAHFFQDHSSSQNVSLTGELKF